MEIKMNKILVEELVSLVEEYINELDDETVYVVNHKRREAADKADREFTDIIRDESKSAEEVEAAAKKANLANAKFHKNNELTQKRNERIAKKVAAFREKLMNTPINAKNTKKAGEEHDNAIIDQYLRNKLEGSYKVEPRVKELKESVSEDCFYDILAIMEDVIDFNKRKRKEDRAKEINRMMASGELESIRQLPNGEIMGDAKVVQKLKDMKKED